MPPFPVSTSVGPGGIVLPGYRHVKTLPNPAAGADALYLVPGGEIHHVLAVHFVLTTSIAVGNRFVRAAVLDAGANVILEAIAFSAQAAGGAQTYNFSPVYASATPSISGVQQIAFPDLFLEGEWVLDFGAHGLDVADQISGVVVFAEVYPIGDGYLPTGAT